MSFSTVELSRRLGVSTDFVRSHKGRLGAWKEWREKKYPPYRFLFPEIAVEEAYRFIEEELGKKVSQVNVCGTCSKEVRVIHGELGVRWVHIDKCILCAIKETDNGNSEEAA